AAVQEPGAGRVQRPRRGHAGGRLRPRRRSVRAADRDDAAGEAAVPRGGVGRDPPADQGGGAAAAERPAERQRLAAEPGGPATAGAGEADQAGAGGAGLDRHEVPGGGPRPALRDGQRPGAGHRALPGRRAGGARAARERLRKFAGKRGGPLATAAGFAALLVAATATSTLLAVRARRAEAAARSERDAAIAARRSEAAARRRAEAAEGASRV